MQFSPQVCIAGKNRLHVSHDRKMLRLRVEPVRSIATKLAWPLLRILRREKNQPPHSYVEEHRDLMVR